MFEKIVKIEYYPPRIKLRTRQRHDLSSTLRQCFRHLQLSAGQPAGGEALILDPVLEKADRYCQLLRELDLRLVKAVDTHLHADHVTGLGELRDRTQCITIMGEQSKADVVSMRVADGDKVMIEGLSLDVMYTPGHTDDSYSYFMGDRVFTGDTLLIRGTGRTDFQNGSSRAQYDSIFNRLLKLPEETMVFPAHDYKGDTVSTIGEEKHYNPRLQVRSVDEYVELMNNLNLPNPKLMDVVVPANMHVGLHQDELEKQGLALPRAPPSTVSAGPTSCWSICARTANAPSTACCPARCTRPTPTSAKACAGRHAARSRRGNRPSRGVLLRLRRTLGDGGGRRQGARALPRQRISKAASTPGRKPAARCCTANRTAVSDPFTMLAKSAP